MIRVKFQLVNSAGAPNGLIFKSVSHYLHVHTYNMCYMYVGNYGISAGGNEDVPKG